MVCLYNSFKGDNLKTKPLEQPLFYQKHYHDLINITNILYQIISNGMKVVEHARINLNNLFKRDNSNEK